MNSDAILGGNSIEGSHSGAKFIIDFEDRQGGFLVCKQIRKRCFKDLK
jgi:hypothetical protein